MKKSILSLACSLLTLASFSQQPTFQWAGALCSGQAEGTNISVDPSGNVLTIGQFTGTSDFDPGPATVTLSSIHYNIRPLYISKLDPAGNFLWVNKIEYVTANAIKTDAAGNMFITGKITYTGPVDLDPGPGTFTVSQNGNGDIFIVKLDPTGNFLWGTAMGSTGADAGFDILIDQASDVYVVGTYNGTIDFDPGVGVSNLSSPTGTTSTFVLKLTNAGSFVWVKTFQAETFAIALDAANIYLTGSFQGTTDLDPGASVFNVTSNGGSDVFVSKLDLTGNFVWAKTIGDALLNDIGKDVDVDAAGNVIVGGVYSGQTDFDPGTGTYTIAAVGGQDVFVLKLDNAGNFSWARSWGGINTDHSKDLALDAAGNIYTTGYFYDVCDFDPGVGSYTLTTTPINVSDGFISKLDPAGNFVWAYRYGAGSTPVANDKINDVAIDAVGGIYMTGRFTGTIDFDPGTGVFNLSPSVPSDWSAFVTKLSGGAVTALSNNPGIYNQSINVYPNPANDIINLKLDTDQFEKLSVNSKIEIYNTLGQIVVTKKINGQNLLLDIKNLNTGLYILNIVNNNAIITTQKIIKE